MSAIKDFYVAGIIMEEAKERKAAAKERLLEAAAKFCPNELAAFEATSAELDAAERRAAEVLGAAIRGAAGDDAQARRALEEHLKTCENPQCPLRAMRGQAAAEEKLN